MFTLKEAKLMAILATGYLMGLKLSLAIIPLLRKWVHCIWEPDTLPEVLTPNDEGHILASDETVQREPGIFHVECFQLISYSL